MITRRNILLLLGASVASTVSTSCTNMLLKGSEYPDSISSVLISSDQKQIVCFGEKHHYVFNTSPFLLALMQSSYRSYVSLSQIDVFVDRKNTTRAGVFFDLSEAAPADARTAAEKDGFRASTKRLELEGMRYASNGIAPASGKVEALNRTYKFNVREAPGAGEMALTPVTVAADGALSIAMIPLVPLGVLGFMFMCGVGDCR